MSPELRRIASRVMGDLADLNYIEAMYGADRLRHATTPVARLSER